MELDLYQLIFSKTFGLKLPSKIASHVFFVNIVLKLYSYHDLQFGDFSSFKLCKNYSSLSFV